MGNLLDLSLAGVGERYTGDVDLREVADQGHFTTANPMWGQVKFD